MSNDINTNQTTKSVPSKTVVSSASSAAIVSRQNVAAQDGNSLPQDSQTGKANSPEQLQKVVANLNQNIQQIQRDLHFSLDEDSGQTVIKVVNSETGETVRQIPSEEALRISHNLQQQLDEATGIIFETSV